MAGTSDKLRHPAVLIAVIVILAIGCGGTSPVSTAPAETAKEAGPLEWLTGVGIRHERFRQEDGTLDAVFSANEMILDENGQFIMHDATIETVASSGQTVLASGARIRADSQGKGDAVLDGGVEVRIDDVIVKTEAATWEAGTGILAGDGPVTVEGNDMSLVCGRFVVAIETRALGVYGIAGHIDLKDESTVPGGVEG
jgi:hypothetical protein